MGWVLSYKFGGGEWKCGGVLIGVDGIDNVGEVLIRVLMLDW